MDIMHEIDIKEWGGNLGRETAHEAAHALEHGKIVLLPQLAFNLSTEEELLLDAKLTAPKYKNISFYPRSGRVRGDASSSQQHAQLKLLMRRYYQHAVGLIITLFPHYQQHLMSGRTSLRTVEIADRTSSYRKDDTLLHVDSFSATPVHGNRILRVFTNINPHDVPRVWQTGEDFATVAKRFIPDIPSITTLEQYFIKLLKMTKTLRSQYDHFMLNIHNKMKKDSNYQQTVPKQTISFMPGSSWIVFTDQVSHAVLSGQHVLEQTFYLPADAMQYPDTAPLHLLESMLTQPLVHKKSRNIAVAA